MSAELLRRAAKLLRERVAELPERIRDGAWEQDSSEIYAEPQHEWVGEALHEDGAQVAYYIKLMHPPVALALADWLEFCADLRGGEGITRFAASLDYPLLIAQAILREPS